MTTQNTSIENIVDSIRRIIARWTATKSPLLTSVSIGDTILNIDASKRFNIGDEIMIRNPLTAETPLYVKSIPNNYSIELTTPSQFHWNIAEDPIIEKTFYQMFIQGIYFGDPDNIPAYPAITVRAMDESSEWLTIDSTKEIYNLEISVYVQDSNQESAERFLINTTNTIKNALKSNIYPLVLPYDSIALTANIVDGDEYIKVADTSKFVFNSRIWIEDKFKVLERRVMEVVDATTLKVAPYICFDFTASDTQIYNLTRFIFNSWPSQISYGKIYKGTMLKSSTISWFAWEERIESGPPVDTHF
jgi:hypothetical protein